jgi:hypothetical protein
MAAHSGEAATNFTDPMTPAPGRQWQVTLFGGVDSLVRKSLWNGTERPGSAVRSMHPDPVGDPGYSIREIVCFSSPSLL